MEKQNKDGIEVEIREHTDADFYPDECPSCKGTEINRHTYKIRTVQDLGAPEICRRIRYEKITFICKTCNKTFGIIHPIVPWGRSYMPSIIKYAIYRVLKKGDSIRRVTSDLNELHHVEVSIGKVEAWINEAGKRGELDTDFSSKTPPEDFSGFISVDGTFKAATTKKNAHKMEKKKVKKG